MPLLRDKEMTDADKAETLQTFLAGILEEIFDPTVWDDSVEKTAKRVAKAWLEYSHSVPGDKLPFEMTTFSATSDGIVLVRDIEFASLCAHHLFPFYGVAHVAYIPGVVQLGLSKFARLVEFLAKRPTSQETLTDTVCNKLEGYLPDASAVACIIESKHTCMSCRGVRNGTASMTSSVLRGKFRTSDRARNELFSLLYGSGR